MKLSKIKTLIVILGCLLSAHKATAQGNTGFPLWPLTYSAGVNMATVDWRPQVYQQGTVNVQPINNQSSTAMTSAAAAFDECGNPVFYALHTGAYLTTTVSGQQLKIVKPDGTEITTAQDRMDCAPRDMEIQVIRLPSQSNKWLIVYNKNFDQTLTSAGNFRYSPLMYSLVEMSAGNVQFIERDVVLTNRNNAVRNYDYGKAVSVTHNVLVNGQPTNVKYLYAKHEQNYNSNPTASTSVGMDQFIITGNGFLFQNNDCVIGTRTFSKGHNDVLDVGTAIEMNEQSSATKLVTTLYNTQEDVGGSKLAYWNLLSHQDFGSTAPEIIEINQLAIAPSDNINDATYNYHVNNSTGYKNSEFFPANTSLGNLARRMSFLEFSPSGRFIYIGHGGNGVTTFIGQIDLNSLVTVVINTADPTAWIDYDTYIVRLKASHLQILTIEKGLDGSIYFAKNGSQFLHRIPNPDAVFTNLDFLPTNIFNTNSISLGTNAFPNLLPDACDQEDYGNSAFCTLSEGCESCITSFAPVPGKTYLLGAWVSEETASLTKTTFDYPQIFIDFPGTNITAGPFTASGKIIDGWQRVEELFTVPANATSISIRLVSTQPTASLGCYFDDIRVFPKDGSMKSYVYDPSTLRLMAELDERNYATFYEYDEEGMLSRVKKETERGVMTIKEVKNSMPKRTN